MSEYIQDFVNGKEFFAELTQNAFATLDSEYPKIITKVTSTDNIDDDAYYYYKIDISNDGDRATRIKHENNFLKADVTVKDKITKLFEKNANSLIFQVKKSNSTAGGRKSRRSRKSRKSRKQRKSRRSRR